MTVTSRRPSSRRLKYEAGNKPETVQSKAAACVPAGAPDAYIAQRPRHN
jgi:hypothetical protein